MAGCRSCGTPNTNQKENIKNIGLMEYTEEKEVALEQVIQIFDMLGHRRGTDITTIKRMYNCYNVLFNENLVCNLDARRNDLVYRQLRFGVYEKYKVGNFKLVKEEKTSPLTDDNVVEPTTEVTTPKTQEVTPEPTKPAKKARKPRTRKKSGDK